MKPRKRAIAAHKEGAVIAGDIHLIQGHEILNPDAAYLHHRQKTQVRGRLGSASRQRFCQGDENKRPDQPLGLIPIDSFFSPVTRVRYSVENARVGQRTDYDKFLILEIWTDGRLTPDDALIQASAILRHHLDVFVGYDEDAVEFDEPPAGVSDESMKMRKLLNMSVNEIELSVRAANRLNNANITTVGQLAQKSEAEMLKYRNFGKKSLNEIKDKLAAIAVRSRYEIRSGPRRYANGSQQRYRDFEWFSWRRKINNYRHYSKIEKGGPMRHQKKTLKLGLTAAHRKALLANQVCSLIEHERIKTTLAKAKAVRPLAEKMVTLGKKGSLHAQRTALAVLRQKEAVMKLFDEIAPRAADSKWRIHSHH